MKLFSILTLISILHIQNANALSVNNLNSLKNTHAFESALLTEENDSELLNAAVDQQLQGTSDDKISIFAALRAYHQYKRNHPSEVKRMKEGYKKLKLTLADPESELNKSIQLTKELCNTATHEECSQTKKLIVDPKIKSIINNETYSWLNKIIPTAHADEEQRYYKCSAGSSDVAEGGRDMAKHLLIIGHYTVDCEENRITFTNIGPGLFISADTEMLVACALPGPGTNVGVIAGGAAGFFGASTGLYLGSNGICIETSVELIAGGAFAGLSIMNIK